jgi:DNA-binding Xre family transcriptional regulator
MKIYWKVKMLSKKQGLTMSKLAFVSQVHRQSLYPFWNGTAEQIWFRTLVRVAKALKVEPCDLFEFHDDGNDDWLEIAAIPEEVVPDVPKETRVDIRTVR